MLLDVLGDAELPSNGPADFYIGLDDVTLTYCLPCNFDDLPGTQFFILWSSIYVCNINV